MTLQIFKIVRAAKVVAHGVIFPNGKCVVSWVGPYASIVVWDSYSDMDKVNGHAGTTFVFDT